MGLKDLVSLGNKDTIHPDEIETMNDSGDADESRRCSTKALDVPLACLRRSSCLTTRTVAEVPTPFDVGTQFEDWAQNR